MTVLLVCRCWLPSSGCAHLSLCFLDVGFTNETVQWPHLYDSNVCEVFRVEATGKDKESATCAHESCSGVGEVVRENNGIATGRGDGS